jgi:hypothetical protein
MVIQHLPVNVRVSAAPPNIPAIQTDAVPKRIYPPLSDHYPAAGKQNHHLRISRTCIMNLKDFFRSATLIVALAAFDISSGKAGDKDEAKHSSKITKLRPSKSP